MKKNKGLWILTAGIIGIAAIAVLVNHGSTVTVEQPQVEVVEEITPSEYEARVQQKMKDTQEEWVNRHHVWAQQEVSKEIISEQEDKLKSLREEEVSL